MEASELIKRYNKGERDFQGVDLEGADLRAAHLERAHLEEAHLERAHLEGADFDFSVWPLWCGSFDVFVDMDLVYQLSLHICKLNNDSSEFKKIKKFLIPYANKFHRIGKDVEAIPVVVQRKR